jgi:hypothetical protein
MLPSSQKFVILLICCAGLAACGAPAPTPTSAPRTGQTAPSAALTPRAFLPVFAAPGTARRVLFVNGDHIPESGYPHSRVRDDGSKPESFSRLRAEVLEGELGLQVDEFILTDDAALSRAQLAPYTLVVLGANGRLLRPDEVAALTEYYEAGGRVIVYADFQYGPDNWASDNRFLNQFGIEVFPDNFQPATQITDLVADHPIMQGVRAFATEGSSQFLISAASLGQTLVLAKCSPLERPGCAVGPAEQAKIKPGDVVACTWARQNARGGKLAGTCDRNTFHNGPGPGTDIDQFDNRTYARNLFRWLTE